MPLVTNSNNTVTVMISKNVKINTSNHLLGYIDLLNEKGYSIPTINAYRAHLQRFLNYLKEKELYVINQIEVRNYLLFLINEKHYSTSAQNNVINALKIFYIAGAPSTAYVYYKHYRSDLPSHLVELVKITEITDTASYTTPAPLTLNSSLEEYSWEDIIWFVEDACKTALTIDEHNELIQIFSLEGWQGLWKNNILSRIKSLRNERTISKKLVEAIEIKDFIIVVDKPEHYNMAYIAHELMKKGAKGAAYLTEFPTYVKISLRLSKNLSEQEIDRYRVDLLAKRLNGGGHKPAAGAQTRTLTEALEKIELWAKTNDFTFEIIDLRNRKKK